MNRALFLAVAALALGVIVILASVAGGFRLSWWLLLGALLLADGVLRLMALRDEAELP